MEKIMPLELLSSIEGARSSEAITELFNVIRKASTDNREEASPETGLDIISVESLRGDQVEPCPGDEKRIIRQNFPAEKNGFLVVPKVIED